MRPGRAAFLTWFVGGFVVLLAATLLQVGPAGWMSAWQVRHWGRDDPVLSFLPGFVVLVVPAVLLQLLPRWRVRPFPHGAQDTPATPPTSERRARVLLRFAQAGLIAAPCFLLAGGLGFGLVAGLGNRGAGRPLPVLALAAVTGLHDVLPGYARLAGATRRPDATWLHEHTIRRTLYLDAYTPLVETGWRPGEPVAVLEKREVVAGEPVPPPGGPIEGSLARGTLPGWMLGELRRRGVAVVDDPVVLTRRELDGKVPGADMVVAGFCGVLGVMFGLLFLAASMVWLHQRRRLLGGGAGGKQ